MFVRYLIGDLGVEMLLIKNYLTQFLDRKEILNLFYNKLRDAFIHY